MIRRLSAALLLLVMAAIGYFAMAFAGLFGEIEPAGEVAPSARPEAVVAERTANQKAAARRVGVPNAGAKQVLFGDLHVHTTYSVDAFLRSLPILQGEGAHPPADACDFARFCSALDFFSINDHAEGLSPALWQETVASIRQCEAVSGPGSNPDLVPYLGWEWTQMGRTPGEHYGHKNVVLRDLDRVPTRPIAAAGRAFDGMRQQRGGPQLVVMSMVDFANRDRYYDFGAMRRDLAAVPVCPDGVDVHDLPPDCAEAAATPRALFEKLDQWGLPAIVIPHGNAWGTTAPAGISWDKQLENGNHDPARQMLVEMYSGHGSSESYRPWRHRTTSADGTRTCPQPVPGFEASCWRAGEIIRARCLLAGERQVACEERAGVARQRYLDAEDVGHMTVPGQTPEDWLDAGQCQDCFQPAFDYRPGGTTQYAMSLDREADDGGPDRFRFGFIASSDNHTARAGSGYKEVAPTSMTDTEPLVGVARRARLQPPRGEAVPRSRVIDPTQVALLPGGNAERHASYYYTGGLVAAHARGRDRGAIWDALRRREVYATSGPRILLWFDLLNPREDSDGSMGSEHALSETPRFRVRAVGSLRQRPGCPDHAVSALSPERLEALCRGECYHPSDERLAIQRIEVVRIRPSSVARFRVIDDPWRVLPCAGDAAGCTAEFSDPDFTASRRDAVYYVRAIQEATPQINGGQPRCERDADGRCMHLIQPCRTGIADTPDDCLAEDEARAWSSPIFIDYAS